MFKIGSITAYPTDTSFGLGVRADDVAGLEALYALKQRPSTKYTSLMVRDWAMLEQFADIPPELPQDFFSTQPRTALLKPKNTLPESEFWPGDKVGFRVCQNPDVAAAIEYPITATSANLSGEPNIYDPQKIIEQWGNKVELFPESKALDPNIAPSEIWDYTNPARLERIR